MDAVEEKKPSYEEGVGWMLLSTTCLATSFLFLKINLLHLDYFLLLFLRFFLPLLLIVLIVLVLRKWHYLKTSVPLSLQLFRAFCVLVTQYGVGFYITKNTLLNASVLLNTSPLFIPLIEWIFFHHRPGKSTIVGALFCFVGMLFILRPDHSLFTPMGLIGLAAALGQAGSQVLYGMKPKGENALGSLFYLFLFTSIVGAIVFLFLDFGSMERYIEVIDWPNGLCILAMGGAMLLNQCFRGLAYRSARPSSLATFLYFAVFISVFFDWFVFKQPPTYFSIIGASLVVLGGVLKMVLRSKIRASKAKQDKHS